jgi:hypothetical protein
MSQQADSPAGKAQTVKQRLRLTWPRPSTRALTREARRTPDYSLFDFLHGYVYARWPYLYIGIGAGTHPLARIFGPPFRLVSRFLPCACWDG